MPDSLVGEPHASTTCAFCRIIRGEEKASIVFEDSFSLAFSAPRLAVRYPQELVGASLMNSDLSQKKRQFPEKQEPEGR